MDGVEHPTTLPPVLVNQSCIHPKLRARFSATSLIIHRIFFTLVHVMNEKQLTVWETWCLHEDQFCQALVAYHLQILELTSDINLLYAQGGIIQLLDFLKREGFTKQCRYHIHDREFNIYRHTISLNSLITILHDVTDCDTLCLDPLSQPYESVRWPVYCSNVQSATVRECAPLLALYLQSSY